MRISDMRQNKVAHKRRGQNSYTARGDSAVVHLLGVRPRRFSARYLKNPLACSFREMTLLVQLLIFTAVFRHFNICLRRAQALDAPATT
ncbi:hypothetical protein EVAR_65261_1 [Eumeta japonica]|uniref:Uncharacterized protein n=1 Tax=Eumeta variegata TaxID=151549 RepID=A0A4C1ZCP5_EUMVA|nr:hypothetical protein EVAR_65261_1 [Eumeta japonica]